MTGLFLTSNNFLIAELYIKNSMKSVRFGLMHCWLSRRVLYLCEDEGGIPVTKLQG